jgi:glutaminase
VQRATQFNSIAQQPERVDFFFFFFFFFAKFAKNNFSFKMSRMFGSGSAQISVEETMLHRLLANKKREIREIFNAIDVDGRELLTRDQLEAVLEAQGLDVERPSIMHELDDVFGSSGALNFEQFADLLDTSSSGSGAPSSSSSGSTLRRALNGELSIPNFPEFCEDVVAIFESSRSCRSGENASYIPQLKEVDSELYGMALCTVDGQEFSYGDANVELCMQSCVKPFMYLMACSEHGIDHVHNYIGREPSGVAFNAFTLNSDRKPHNPMINSGAITSCSLIQTHLSESLRFANVLQYLSDCAGGSKISFNQPTFLSERETADRNFALGYFMKHEGVFKRNIKLQNTLEFYFQACSTEVNCSIMARMAAALANNGISPVTGKRIASPGAVKSCIQLLFSCGMYDYSGEWACTIGLPSKSGVSGAIFVVIPNVLGLCVWSPRLDPRGNSARGVEFCRRLTQHFSFSIFDQLLKSETKVDPTVRGSLRRFRPSAAPADTGAFGSTNASSSSSSSHDRGEKRTRDDVDEHDNDAVVDDDDDQSIGQVQPPQQQQQQQQQQPQPQQQQQQQPQPQPQQQYHYTPTHNRHHKNKRVRR